MRTARARTAVVLSLVCGVLFVVFSFRPAAQGRRPAARDRRVTSQDQRPGPQGQRGLNQGPRPIGQDQKDHAQFARLTEKALTSGPVGVIVHVAVPAIRQLTAASAQFSGRDASAAVTVRRANADMALREAIGGAVSRVMTQLQGTGVQINAQYASIPFVALRIDADGLSRLDASPDVLGIEEDVPVPLIDPGVEPGDASGAQMVVPPPDQPQLNVSVPLIGAPTAWSWGYTGSGWYVAILDTGIRKTHQFFTGKNIVEACFARGSDGASGAGDCPNGSSTMIGPGAAALYPSTYGGYDHGTHVAGIATGNYGSLAGVAKNASIIAVQVFSKFSGGSLSSWDSDTLAALDYVYSIRGSYNVASINMSLGGDLNYSPCDSDSRKASIDNLRAAGIATAIATGNDGSCGGISEPGCISSAIAVGSSDDYDHESSFNNWSATMQKVFAPGSSIYSSIAASDSSYGYKSGTSMATPHVAGAFALLKQAAPGASVTDLLSALQSSGAPISSHCGAAQLPRIQVDGAIAFLTQFHLTIETSQFGTTNPTPGIHGYPTGTQVQITAIPDTYAMFMNWSGDATGTANPVTVTIDSDKTVTATFRYIYAPDANGHKVLNRSFSQAEYINVLSWQPNPANQGLPINRYRIYTVNGDVRTLLVELPSNRLQYQHRNVGQTIIEYNIVAVTSGDREGAPAVVTVQ